MSTQKYYREAIITASADDLAFINEILWGFEPLGIEERDDSLLAFFDDASDPARIEEELRRLREEKAIGDYSIACSRMENRNWNEEWEKSLSVLKAGKRFVIRPTFKEYAPSAEEIVLTIDPKMSFGTGEHQTTKLMLEVLEDLDVRGKRILDVGTGTGILAIAAVKLGADFALAIDNDDWCYDNGIENVQLNNAGDTVEIRTAVIEDTPENDFDIILANIQKNVLLAIRTAIAGRVKQGGIIALSGLLLQDETDIRKAYEEQGLDFLRKFTMDEWIALTFRKR